MLFQWYSQLKVVLYRDARAKSKHGKYFFKNPESGCLEKINKII